MNPQQLYAAIHEPKKGLEQLAYKENRKLTTQQILAVVNLLRSPKYGAQSDIADATGKTLDFYINEVQLIPENDRRALLQALGFPVTPRIIKYTDKDFPEAIQRLDALKQLLQQYGLGQKVSMVIWTVQQAGQE